MPGPPSGGPFKQVTAPWRGPRSERISAGPTPGHGGEGPALSGCYQVSAGGHGGYAVALPEPRSTLWQIRQVPSASSTGPWYSAAGPPAAPSAPSYESTAAGWLTPKRQAHRADRGPDAGLHGGGTRWVRFRARARCARPPGRPSPGVRGASPRPPGRRTRRRPCCARCPGRRRACGRRGSRVPSPSRPERTASRSAFVSPWRRPGPVGSTCRPNPRVAQGFAMEMDHLPGLLRT